MKLTKWLLALVALVSIAACDKDGDAPRDEYGYVQFRLFKSGSYVQTRAEVDSLDYLADAAKIKVTLRNDDGRYIYQTVTLDAQNDSLAEFGMQSDKFQLLTGGYQITAYELYSAVDERRLANELETPIPFTIVPGGLVLQDIVVAVKGRGFVEFNLRSEMSSALADEVDELRTRAATTPIERPFQLIESIDFEITSVNLFPQQKLKIEKLRIVKHEGQISEEPPYTYISRCISDSIISVPAGKWQVTSFTTYYDDERKASETSIVTNAPMFTVKDNAVTTTDVLITMSQTAGSIRDAIALKKIWDALDGPNWKKNKWDFNRDVDLWLAQTGVFLDNATGRVTTLDLTDMEARGEMPAELGELTELKTLYLGSHVFVTGSSTLTPRPDDLSEVPLPDVMEDMNLSNYITSLPQEINNLTKLENIYIGYSAIQTIPDDLSGLVSLKSMEMFYCPQLTDFPKGIATLPKLATLIFSNNWNVPADKMRQALVDLNAAEAAKAKPTIQGLNFPEQSIGTIPDLTAMKKMSTLDIRNCDVTAFEKAFGEDIFIGLFNASGNMIESLPTENGYFMGEGDGETFDFSNNLFTELPDIFYRTSFSSINFSGNRITKVQNDGDGDPAAATFRPLNTDQLWLTDNDFTVFPKVIFHSGSTIQNFYFSGNAVTKMDDDTFDIAKAKNVNRLRQFTMSYNKLSALPESFNGANMPAVIMVDFNGNRFKNIPRNVVSLRAMEVLRFREQRDEYGNRCMTQWPDGIATHPGLFQVFLGSNDIGEIRREEAYNPRIFNRIYVIEIADNPNISLALTEVECQGITMGNYFLQYDPSQDISGCNALRLD
jgi:Leucine-rich repeat (LRR) protein